MRPTRMLPLLLASLAQAEVSTRPFGETDSGAPTTLYTIRSSDGLEVAVLDNGATLQAVRAISIWSTRASRASGGC